jgi:hypothetical protein
MEKKTIYYILGGVAVIGIGYYLWNKNKKASEEKESTDATAKTEESTTDIPVVTADAKTKELKIDPKVGSKNVANAVKVTPVVVKKLTAQELESKLQNGCGKKPKLKKNKVKYEQCRVNLLAKLTNQGLAFDGSSYFEGLAEINRENNIREMSFAEQVINREDGRLFAGNVYNN